MLRKRQHNHAKARHLRRNLSLPEALLWRALRGKPKGVAFRRQHPVGACVIDFYCAAAKTGFEIDGIAHDMGNRPERDVRRDAFLAGQGIRIVRIAAREVLADLVGVAEAIVGLCLEARNDPSTTAFGGGPPPHFCAAKTGRIGL